MIQTPTTPMWTLQQGIDMARLLEEIATGYGLHVALGGSVMYSGQSDNDLDIFVYPHKTTKGSDIPGFKLGLSQAGMRFQMAPDHTPYGDTKEVEIWHTHNNKQLDLFFL